MKTLLVGVVATLSVAAVAVAATYPRGAATWKAVSNVDSIAYHVDAANIKKINNLRLTYIKLDKNETVFVTDCHDRFMTLPWTPVDLFNALDRVEDDFPRQSKPMNHSEPLLRTQRIMCVSNEMHTSLPHPPRPKPEVVILACPQKEVAMQ